MLVKLVGGPLDGAMIGITADTGRIVLEKNAMLDNSRGDSRGGQVEAPLIEPGAGLTYLKRSQGVYVWDKHKEPAA